MFKKVVTLFILGFASITQAAQTSNVGVINLERVMMETKAGKSLNEQLKKIKTDFQNKYNKTGQDLENRKNELEKQKAALSKDAFAKKEKEFIKKAEEAQNSFNMEAEAIDAEGRKAFTDFNMIVLEAVNKIATENKFTHVMPAAVFAYFDKTTEITDKVIAEIDSKITNFPIKSETKK